MLRISMAPDTVVRFEKDIRETPCTVLRVRAPTDTRLGTVSVLRLL